MFSSALRIIGGLFQGIAFVASAHALGKVIMFAVAAACGLFLFDVLTTIMPWIFDTAQWIGGACWIFSSLFATVYSILPTDLQTQLTGAINWLSTNDTVEAVWRLAWYFVGIFCNTTVIVLCFTTYITTLFVAFALRLAKGAYDLIPTRG